MIGLFKKQMGWIFVGVLLALLVACQPETVVQQVEVTRVMEYAAAPAAEPVMDGDFSRAASEMEAGQAVANTTTTDATLAPSDRLIIRTGNLDIVVSDTEGRLAEIGRMAEAQGGWIVNSSTSQYMQGAKQGNITIRVPAEQYEATMTRIKEMAVEVRSENSSGQDVTEEFVDLESRLGNLEATADRVRLFLDDATKVEDALAVNQELSRLEGEIEVIKGRMQYLSQSAAFSTISVYLTPDIATQPIEIGGWRPEGIAREAIEALVDALQSLGTFFIWLAIYILPLFIVLVLPVYYLGRWLWRRVRRARTG